jgi:orotate phosphoribosyltransferase
MDNLSDEEEDYHDRSIDTLARIFAANVKFPPAGQKYFTATSGVHLRYYVSLTTNLLLPTISKLTSFHMKRMIHSMVEKLKLSQKPNLDLYCIGPETAGGILVSQICVNWTEDDERIIPMNFVYWRKSRKLTGTRQQLEGPPFITNRDRNSSPALAIWLDDVISTGKSLLDGKRKLKEEYNITVVGAAFIVDRSSDRKRSSPFYHKDLSKILIGALMDEERIKQFLKESNHDDDDDNSSTISEKKANDTIFVSLCSVLLLVLWMYKIHGYFNLVAAYTIFYFVKCRYSH